jgi:hypothetical protein
VLSREEKGLGIRSGPSFSQVSTHLRLATILSTAITPPVTRKRKALEAAIEDDENSFDTASSASKGCEASTRQSSTTHFPASLRNRVLGIATPTTTAEAMDSDDDFEFMTDASSAEDFLGPQDSDDESLGEGQSMDCHNHPHCILLRGIADFGEELDASFSYDKDIVKIAKKLYEVEFKVLSPADIEKEQNQQVNEVSAILGLPSESAAILLRFARWNRERLIESYMDHPDDILEDAGLGDKFVAMPKTEAVPGFTCAICCEDDNGLETYAMRCGHRFCVDCFQHYLSQKIKEEGEAARIQCPQDNCHRIVDSKSLGLLVADDLKDR